MDPRGDACATGTSAFGFPAAALRHRVQRSLPRGQKDSTRQEPSHFRPSS